MTDRALPFLGLEPEKNLSFTEGKVTKTKLKFSLYIYIASPPCLFYIPVYFTSYTGNFDFDFLGDSYPHDRSEQVVNKLLTFSLVTL